MTSDGRYVTPKSLGPTLQLLLSRDDLRAMGITLSRWSLARLEAKGAFPKSVRIGGKRLGWRRDEVIAWIEQLNR